MKKTITEEMNIHEEWFKEAKKQTLETLPDFLKRLTEDYQHDDSTIIHAIGAAGIAAMHALDHSEVGGITGFQAGFCAYDVVKHWSFENNKCGFQIVSYDDFLYPQYLDRYRTIPRFVWENIQKEAACRIEEYNKEHAEWVKKHTEWVEAVKKFEKEVEKWQTLHHEYPEYRTNPEYYIRIHEGTAEDWKKQEEKEKAGVIFRPDKPVEPKVNPNVMKHWINLSKGKIPFGIFIED